MVEDVKEKEKESVFGQHGRVVQKYPLCNGTKIERCKGCHDYV